jgi:isopenicillin-N N-acyltransferase like protein
MQTFELPLSASARGRGRAHGEAFREQIQALSELRLGLTMVRGRIRDREGIIDVAARHLPLLAGYDEALSEELLGIAEGADVSPEMIVILNHYTDLRDIGHESLDDLTDEGCTAIYTRTPTGPLLGQTWDMHGSASPFVVALRVPAEGDDPGSWVLSIAGCLGMTGMNAAGVGVTINNLNSLDAHVGLVWPALVRRVLRAQSAVEAKDLIWQAPLGAGHHYITADASGDVFGVETSGRRKRLIYAGEQPSCLHTNHCLSDEINEVSWVTAGSSTYRRFEAASASLGAAAVLDRQDLWGRLTGEGVYLDALPDNPDPHAIATCGTVVMDLSARRLLVGRRSEPVEVSP